MPFAISKRPNWQQITIATKAERHHFTDDQTVWPSPEALHLATAVIRRGYMLPETMEHPIIKFECTNLALLLMAWGLVPTAAACRIASDGADTPVRHLGRRCGHVPLAASPTMTIRRTVGVGRGGPFGGDHQTFSRIVMRHCSRMV